MPKPTPMETEDLDQLIIGGKSLMNGKMGDLTQMSWVLGRLTLYICAILKNGVVTVDECANCSPMAVKQPWGVWAQANLVKIAWPLGLVVAVAMITKSPIADAAAAWMMKLGG